MAALRVRSAIGLTAALLIAVAVATGCTASPAAPDRASASQSVTTGGTTHTPTGAASKSGDGTLRTDLEPLTTRFAALGAPVSAQWSSGTMGDSRVPGPSTYWIDAVVVVSPDVASRLATLEVGPSNAAPDLVPDVAALGPSGELLTSPGLQAAFAIPDWAVTPYLVSGTNTVVIAAVGGT